VAYPLRYYEKKGIIEPSRSQGNIRFYSEVILRMRQYIAELERSGKGHKP